MPIRTQADRIEHTLRINYKPWLVTLVLFVCDTLSISASFLLAFTIRKLFIPTMGGIVYFQALFPLLLMILVVVIGLFVINGLYPGGGRTGVVELKEILRIVTIAYVILGLTIFVLGYGTQFSRAIFLMTWVLCCILISFLRVAIHNRGSLISWWGQPVVVVGNGKDVEDVVANLYRARRMAFKPVIALILDVENELPDIPGVPTYPYSQELQAVIKKKGVKLAMFAGRSIELDAIQSHRLRLLSVTFPRLIYVMGESPLSPLSMQVIDLEGHPALRVQYNLLIPWARYIKRLADLIICITTFAITFPIFLICALLIRIDSPGPIIYVQKRMGKDGQIFDLFKFRTMKLNSESALEDLLQNDEEMRTEYETHHKLRNDPRVTIVGRFLRKISFDEFPQLWNVLRGEMSLVGPRAYLPEEKEEMGDYVDIIHRVAPGLTGWWQVMGRHDLIFEKRLQLDAYYISNFSLWMDLYIMIKTVWIVISGKGA